MNLPRIHTQDEFLALCRVMLSNKSTSASVGPSPPSTSASSFNFKCSLCGKAFSSYQALGGHKSSHRLQPTARPGLIRPVETYEGESSGGPHRCNVCLRGFSTGQALGGHKRFHYWDSSVNATSSTSASTSNSNGNYTTTSRGFDLNLPPPPVVVVGEVGWVVEGEEEVESPPHAKKLRLS